MKYQIWKLIKGIGKTYKLAELVSAGYYDTFEEADFVKDRWQKDAIKNELYDITYIIQIYQ